MASEPEGQTREAEMARFGIVRVAVEYFDWGGYRYSSLEHAIAAAKRLDNRGV